MSKPALFGVMFTWLFILTYVVNSITTYDETSGLGVNNPIGIFQRNDGGFLTQTTSLLNTLWSGITFNIDGLPTIFSLFFLVPAAVIGFMILRFVIDAIPF